MTTSSGAKPKLTMTSHPPPRDDVMTCRPTSGWTKCDVVNCSKKYRNVNALIYHHNHSHRRHLDDVIKHSTSASDETSTGANFVDGDDNDVTVIRDGGQNGENRKRKCDDVMVANESRDGKCWRISGKDAIG